MIRKFFILAALFVAATVNAQTDIDMGKFFTFQKGDNGKPQPIELNEASTVKEGVVFIGDTRAPENIQEGKYRGMRATQTRRFFTVNGANRQYQAAMAFRRAPQAATKDHKVDPTLVPRSCMLQLKPASNGTLTLCGETNKVEGQNIYVAVRNGLSFKNLATLKFVKDEAVKGRKDTPYQPQSCEYQYADGDELWIYSDGGVSLYGILFTGTIDTAFTGSDPVEVNKAVRKAQKK